jgi:hypothetical protein
MKIEKHFVTFLSPGTFFNEESIKEIDSWNVNKALEMSKEITERHGAKPYAFYFTTRTREDNEFDSKETAYSNRYYLGGKIETIKEIEERNDPNEKILLLNMRSNNWDRVIININSWKITQPLEKDDIVLQY